MDLLETRHIDVVCIDDVPVLPLEPVLRAIGEQISAGRIGAFAVWNWTAERIREAQRIARDSGLAGIAAVMTTEFALLTPTEPLWPEYPPFDTTLAEVVREFRLPVFAHSIAINRGDPVLDPKQAAPMAERRLRRWVSPRNYELAARAREFATKEGMTAPEAALAWLLNQPIPTIAILNLAEIIDTNLRLETASQWRFDPARLR
jgi:aryl-alcohol dehydrogenase-like predicted oxidoreductase